MNENSGKTVTRFKTKVNNQTFIQDKILTEVENRSFWQLDLYRYFVVRFTET